MHECLNDDQLDALLDAPAGDPRLADVETCPDCGSRMRLLRALVGDVAAAPASAESRERVDRLVAQALGSPQEPVRGIVTPMESARPRRAWGGNRLLAVAASLAVTAGGIAWWLSRPVEERAEMRGRSSAFDARVADPDSTRIAWAAVAGAERYRVFVLSPELAEWARAEVGGATEFALAPESRPTAVPAGSAVLVRVVALRGGDEIASSRFVSARWP